MFTRVVLREVEDVEAKVEEVLTERLNFTHGSMSEHEFFPLVLVNVNVSILIEISQESTHVFIRDDLGGLVILFLMVLEHGLDLSEIEIAIRCFAIWAGLVILLESLNKFLSELAVTEHLEGVGVEGSLLEVELHEVLNSFFGELLGIEPGEVFGITRHIYLINY